MLLVASQITISATMNVMGTSVRMIELHYGSLLDGAGAAIARALDALDAQRDRATAERSEDV